MSQKFDFLLKDCTDGYRNLKSGIPGKYENLVLEIYGLRQRVENLSELAESVPVLQMHTNVLLQSAQFSWSGAVDCVTRLKRWFHSARSVKRIEAVVCDLEVRGAGPQLFHRQSRAVEELALHRRAARTVYKYWAQEPCESD